jgi:hypothetical protein
MAANFLPVGAVLVVIEDSVGQVPRFSYTSDMLPAKHNSLFTWPTNKSDYYKPDRDFFI